MSPRQILFGKKFKTPLCKIRELVMAYNVTSSNKTTDPRAFFALYIGPNDSGTGHIVFKLGTKRLVTTPKCKPKPMAEDVVEVVNEMGKQEGMPDGIQFHNIHHKSTLSDLYADEVGLHDNDNSCASDDNWKDRKNPEVDLKNLVANVGIDNDEVNDLDDEDTRHLNDGFGGIKDTTNGGVHHEQDNQQHHFGGPIENEGEQHDHFGGPDQENKIPDHIVNIDDDDDEDDDRNAIDLIPDDSSNTDSNTRELSDTNEAPLNDDNDTDYLSDKAGTDDPDTTPKLNYLTRNLHSDLDGVEWESSYSHMVLAMVIVEQVGSE